MDKWAYFFMDLFRANGKMGRGQNLFHYWMKENLRVDRPYDDVARSIIAASAKSNHVVAASNVIAREHVQGKPQPDDGNDLGMVQQLDTDDELAILYGKTFLGINLSCISCHDGKGHLEKVNVWLSGKKRSDFFQNAAFLGHSPLPDVLGERQAAVGRVPDRRPQSRLQHQGRQHDSRAPLRRSRTIRPSSSPASSPKPGADRARNWDGCSLPIRSSRAPPSICSGRS